MVNQLENSVTRSKEMQNDTIFHRIERQQEIGEILSWDCVSNVNPC
jgi:hypothetical protein